MFKQGLLLDRVDNHEAKPSGFERLQEHSLKGMRQTTIMLLWRLEISIRETNQALNWYAKNKNQMSHMFWTFLLLTEEGMASCCRAFRKNKNDEEERNLIQNATWIRQYVQWQSRHYFVFPLEWKNARKEKKI